MTEESSTVAEPEKAIINKIKDKRERNKPYSKIVCRRLPPTMTEVSFLEQVSPIPEHDYFYFAKSDSSLAPDLFCRAYINFINAEDVYIFRDKFDDYIFLDDKGNEYPAIVEYAPFQRMPKKRRKKDIKSGTIESDSTYLEFLESLKEIDSDSREPKMEYSYQLTEDVEKKEPVTPLLEYLAARKREDRRRREERQRRRPRNRNLKDDEIPEEDLKNMKLTENDNDTLIENDDADCENVEIKETHFSAKGRKGFKDQKRYPEDNRRKDYYKNESYDDDKNRDKRDRLKDNYKERSKEKFLDKKERFGKFEKDKRFGKFEEDKEKSKNISELTANPESNANSGTIVNKNVDKSSKFGKNALLSSKIKPFTTLPQLKVSELSKVIDELDNNSKKESNLIENIDKINNVKYKESDKQEQSANSTDKTELEKDKVAIAEDVEANHQNRRNSLDNTSPKSSSKNALKKQKSLDDKSESSELSEKPKENDTRSERRIRNKDRPSLAIYKPGMGKFSKQRLEREKDQTKNNDKNVNSHHSSTNSVNSQD